jgi:hypothetical protein
MARLKAHEGALTTVDLATYGIPPKQVEGPKPSEEPGVGNHKQSGSARKVNRAGSVKPKAVSRTFGPLASTGSQPQE